MKKPTILFVSIMLFWACGNSENSQSENNNLSIEDFEAQIPSDMTGKAVEKFNYKLDELLTLEMAADALGLPGGDAEKEYDQTLKNPTYHSITYKWNSGRIETLTLPSGTKFDLPADDFVRLSWLQHSNSDRFKNTYREPTQQELEAFDRILGEETDKLDLADETKDVAKSGLSDGLTSNLKFSDVNGVGDLARWNTKTHELPVYHRGVSFIIELKSGQGSEVDKDLAAKVAKEVVKKL